MSHDNRSQMRTNETDLSPRVPKINEFVRGHGKLVAVKKPPPPPPPPTPPTVYEFDVVTATIEVRTTSDVTIKELATLNDFYGEGTAVEGAIDEAKQHKEGLGDGVIVVVRRDVDRVRKVRHPTGRGSFWDKDFIDFDDASKYGNSERVSSEVVWESDA